MHFHRYKTAIGQSRLIDLPQAGRCHWVIGEFLKQALGRGPQFRLNHLEGSGVIKGGQVVLQARQFFKPVPSHQIGAGGKGLTHLDETGPQAAQGGEDAPGQPLLQPGIPAAGLTHQHQGQGSELPKHHQQPADQDPGAQQQPAQVRLGVVAGGLVVVRSLCLQG